MKSVLISIQPKWVEKITSGEKIIEVRKSRPKLETPFKCYIYCTKENKHYDLYIKEPKAREKYGIIDRLRAGQEEVIKTIDGYKTFIAHGKVIGEFICDRVDKIGWFGNPELIEDRYLKESCLTLKELYKYTKGEIYYEWHISDLKIYDKPKELSEFTKYMECKNTYDCCACHKWDGLDLKCIAMNNEVKRPPQSWCYVEGE